VSVDAAVETEGLHKSYGEVGALRGVDLRVEAGTVFGLLSVWRYRRAVTR
jgi:ABC-type multidrug transport system ATPase subunit